MNTSDVLNKAADLIEERGWTVGGGWVLEGEEQASLCLEGGIMAALGITWPSDEAVTTEHDSLIACPAYRAVAEFIDLPAQNCTYLFSWNDRGGRTAEQVVATLRAAAVIEAAKETADERESMPSC